MKYTRYNYKKKNNQLLTLLIVVLTILFVAFILGSGLSSIFMKNSNNNTNTTDKIDNINTPIAKKEVKETPGLEQEGIVKFIVVQNGLFEKKENAEAAKNNIKEYVNPIAITEEKHVRIIAGIFNEEEANKYLSIFNEKEIPNTKITFQLKNNNLCDTEITELIRAQLEIFNKLNDKSVQSVQSDKIKSWAETLQEVDSSSKNYSVLIELKNKIKSFPKEITRENAEEFYSSLYLSLKKIKQ